MIRLPIFIAMWALFLAIKIPTIVLGLAIVPLLYRYRSTDYAAMPWWTRPWSNPEDWQGGINGIDGASLPQWWIEREGAGFRSFWKYHAIRNPANGLRSFEMLDMDIDMDRVEYRTNEYLLYYEPWHTRQRPGAPSTYWYIAWQGLKSGVKFVHHWNDERHFVFKFGWRVEPRDAHESGEGLLHEDAGFATKLLPYRSG